MGIWRLRHEFFQDIDDGLCLRAGIAAALDVLEGKDSQVVERGFGDGATLGPRLAGPKPVAATTKLPRLARAISFHAALHRASPAKS